MHNILRAPNVPLLCSVLAFVVAITTLGRASAQDMNWSRIDLPLSGISLRVPLGVFEALPADPQAQGQLFLAHDGKAQLLLGAFENDEGRSLAAHRRFVIQSNYAGADIDYAPRRRNWFVLSGTMDTRTFYQRVTFSCKGRLINSWAMIYPTSQKRFYDRIIERMHKSFRAGRGPNGDCRLAALTN